MAKYEDKLVKLYEELDTYDSTASEAKQAVQNQIIALENEIVKFVSDYSQSFAKVPHLLGLAKVDELLNPDEEKKLDEDFAKILAEILWATNNSFEAPYFFFNRLVYEEPENLNFWFDFLDLDGVLNDFSCRAIGARPKAVNDKDVKSIYFRSTPTIIFYENELEKTTHTGYRYFQVANIESMCSVSTQGKSAKEAVDQLLYNHSYALESVSITAIPIYYLELNTRVNIHDERAGISGDYVVTKMTLPLTYNGTMSMTATKAVDYII